MSVSSGASVPGSWTPVQGSNTAGQQTTTPDTSSAATGGAPTTPFAALLTQELTDSISVTLPNGMKVGMFHIGGSSGGFDAQMLQSLEHLADNLSSYSTASLGAVDGTRPGPVSDGSQNTASDSGPQGMRALDMLHVDLPNGVSIEVRHASPNGDADGGVAAMNEMEKAMEELVGHFSNLADAPADSGSAAGNAVSQQKIAAYAEQAKQKALASFTTDPEVNRQS